MIEKHSGFKKALRFADIDAVARNLRIGDTVERHLHDGEYVSLSFSNYMATADLNRS